VKPDQPREHKHASRRAGSPPATFGIGKVGNESCLASPTPRRGTEAVRVKGLIMSFGDLGRPHSREAMERGNRRIMTRPRHPYVPVSRIPGHYEELPHVTIDAGDDHLSRHRFPRHCSPIWTPILECLRTDSLGMASKYLFRRPGLKATGVACAIVCEPRIHRGRISLTFVATESAF